MLEHMNVLCSYNICMLECVNVVFIKNMYASTYECSVYIIHV